MSLAVGDLVAEVIRNADPARQQQALARLQQLAPADRSKGQGAGPVVVPAGVTFDAAMKHAGTTGQVRNFNLQPAAQPPAGQGQPLQAIAREYETLFLQQMLQLVMPTRQDEQGSGVLAADLSRTQMASALASQMAATGDFGIGRQIAQAQIKAAPDAVMAAPVSAVAGVTAPVQVDAADSGFSPRPVISQPAAGANELAAPLGPVRLPDVIARVWSTVEGAFESLGGTTRASDRLERTR
jgi:Rod binding domain-containing protein